MHEIALPLQDAGFARGTVLRQGQVVAGLVVLAERDDGLTTETAVSLSDGYFAFETLAPGVWRFQIDPESLPDGWQSTILDITIHSAQGPNPMRLDMLPMDERSVE